MVFWIAGAGALGAVARWWLGDLVQRALQPQIPCSALLVNVLGCLLFGFVVRLAGGETLSPQVRTVILVGFLGAFTTFSSYVADVVACADQGRLIAAAGLVLAHNGLGLLAFLLGGWLSRLAD
jgi:CrcB protein